MSPHSSPDLPAIPRLERQGGNKKGGRKTLTSPSGPTLSVLSMSRQMGEAETRLHTADRHQPILRSLVSLGICRVPASVIPPDIVNLPLFGLRPMIAQL